MLGVLVLGFVGYVMLGLFHREMICSKHDVKIISKLAYGVIVYDVLF